MIFFSPFFFLLEDSFFGSVVALSAGLAVVPAELPFVVSVAVAAAGAGSPPPEAGGFGGAASVGAVVVPAAPFASPGVVVSAAAPVSPASIVDPLAAPVPGVATAITAVFPGALLLPPAPSAVLPPPLRMSATDALSVSGSILGSP